MSGQGQELNPHQKPSLCGAGFQAGHDLQSQIVHSGHQGHVLHKGRFGLQFYCDRVQSSVVLARHLLELQSEHLQYCSYKEYLEDYL